MANVGQGHLVQQMKDALDLLPPEALAWYTNLLPEELDWPRTYSTTGQ